MGKNTTMLEALGGAAGCRRLSVEFYGRVGKDPILHPLFPGKSQKCAIEEFTAFLIQFLGGDEDQTQRRWWLSLHESHARFQIGPAERGAWLKHMRSTLEAIPLDDDTCEALRQFFEQSSAYVVDQTTANPKDHELATRWHEQHVLDKTIDAIAAGRDPEVLATVPRFASRPVVFVGLLVRMIKSGRADLIHFVTSAMEHDPALTTQCFAGKTLLHFAAGAGCLDVITVLLRLGTNPNIQDSDGHTPLYRVANECALETGPHIVQALVLAGADVNAGSGITKATALHMAARQGHLAVAKMLLDCGADVDVQDRKGTTPLQRAVNCRRHTIVALLEARGKPRLGG